MLTCNGLKKYDRIMLKNSSCMQLEVDLHDMLRFCCNWDSLSGVLVLTLNDFVVGHRDLWASGWQTDVQRHYHTAPRGIRFFRFVTTAVKHIHV